MTFVSILQKVVGDIFVEHFEYLTSQDAEVTGSGAEATGSSEEATGSSAEATGSSVEATGVGRTMEPAGSDVDLVRTETKKINRFAIYLLVCELGTTLSNVANVVI